MKIQLRFILLLLLAWGTFMQKGISMQASSTYSLVQDDARDAKRYHVKMKKPGFFQRIHAYKAIKKYLREHAKEGDAYSNIASAAFLLFLFFMFFMLFGLLSSFAFLLYVSATFLLASNILSAIILYSEENPKSRNLARFILLFTWVYIPLMLILLGLLIYLFLQAIWY